MIHLNGKKARDLALSCGWLNEGQTAAMTPKHEQYVRSELTRVISFSTSNIVSSVFGNCYQCLPRILKRSHIWRDRITLFPFKPGRVTATDLTELWCWVAAVKLNETLAKNFFPQKWRRCIKLTSLFQMVTDWFNKSGSWTKLQLRSYSWWRRISCGPRYRQALLSNGYRDYRYYAVAWGRLRAVFSSEWSVNSNSNCMILIGARARENINCEWFLCHLQRAWLSWYYL